MPRGAELRYFVVLPRSRNLNGIFCLSHRDSGYTRKMSTLRERKFANVVENGKSRNK